VGAAAAAGTRRLPFLEAMPRGSLFAAWSPERWFEVRAQLMSQLGDEPRLVGVLRGARAAGLAALAARLGGER
jgi:hypothetical protein